MPKADIAGAIWPGGNYRASANRAIHRSDGLDAGDDFDAGIGTEGLLYLFDESKVTIFSDGNRVGGFSTDNDIYVAHARLTYHLQ